jgi:hypothetical protein
MAQEKRPAVLQLRFSIAKRTLAHATSRDFLDLSTFDPFRDRPCCPITMLGDKRSYICWSTRLNEQVTTLILFGSLCIVAILVRVAAGRAHWDHKCPYCGWHQVRRSSRHGLQEWLLKRLFILPYRCLACSSRFFRFGLHPDGTSNNGPQDQQAQASPRLNSK